LQNVIERALILSRQGPLRFDLSGTHAEPMQTETAPSSGVFTGV